MVQVRRIDTSLDGIVTILKDIETRVSQQETQASGHIVIRDTLTTTDPTTGVKTIFGTLPDGTSGFLPFVNDITPPPVPTVPTVTSPAGAAIATWDGKFAANEPAPPDFQYCRIYGQRSGDTKPTLFGSVINANDSVIAGADVVTPSEVWTFWATSVDFNGNESAASVSSAPLTIAAPADNSALTAQINDNTNKVNAANAAVATKSTVWLQATTPNAPSGNRTGDTWFDTSNGNKPMSWDGSNWVSAQDASIAIAQSAANNAQTAANGKNTIISAASAPATAGHINGDVWFDTAHGNKPMTFSGTGWVSVQDASIAAAQTAATNAQIAANGKNTIISAASAPVTAGHISGDVWFDTSNGNKPMVFTGSAWTSAQDASIATAQSAATTAQTTANGKNVIISAASPPTSTARITGDIWIDTAHGNLLNTWNGTAWVSAQDAAISAAAGVAASKGKTLFSNTAPVPDKAFAWTGTANASTSQETDKGTVARTNLATNPSFETASGTVTVATNYAVTPSFEGGQGVVQGIGSNPASFTSQGVTTDQPHTGTASYKFNNCTVAGQLGFKAMTGMTSPFQGMPLAAGDVLSWSFWVYSTVAGSVFPYWEGIKQADSTYTGGNGAAAATTVPANTWTKVTGTFTMTVASYVQGAGGYQLAMTVGASAWIDDFTIVKGQLPAAYFDGSTPIQNLVANSSFETDTTGFSPGTNVTLSATSAQAFIGSKSMAITRTTTTVGGGFALFQFSAVAGVTYTFSAYVYGGSGNYSFSSGAQTNFTAPGNQWVRKSLTFTPTTSGNAGIYIHDDNNASPTIGTVLYVDAVLLEASPTLNPYYAGQGDFTYAWTGAANASTSVQQALGVAGTGYVSSLAYAYQSKTGFTGGSKAIRITPVNINNGDSFAEVGSMFSGYAFKPNTTYTISGDRTITTPQTNLAGTQHFRINVGTELTPTIINGPVNVAGTVRVVATFTTGTGVGLNFIRIYNGASAGGGDVWWDNLLLEEGITTGSYFDGSTPSTSAADLWVDTSGTPAKNTPNVWGGTAWIPVTDSTATTALSTANGKNTITYSSSSASGSGKATGDIWFQTNGSNIIIGQWQWSGTAWVQQTIDSVVIANLDAGKITAGTINAARIGAQSIDATKLSANSVTATAIAAQTITGSLIAGQTIVAGNIATGTITTNQIAAGTITASNIATDTITAGNIAAGAITASELAVGSVTAQALSANSVSATAMVANTITAGQIAAGAIDATKLSANSVSATAMVANTITANQIAGQTITAVQLAAGSITASAIAANAITANALSANSVTASAIAAGSITASAMVAGTITASSGIIGSINADTISTGTINASFVSIGAGTNALSDPGFNSPSITAARTSQSTGGSAGWTISNGSSTGYRTAARNTVTTSGVFSYLTLPHTFANAGQLIPCVVDQVWNLKVDTSTSAAANINFQTYAAKADGTVSTTTLTTTSLSSTGQRSITASYTVPAGVTGFLPGLICDTSGITWTVYGNAFVGQQITGDLLVNGAIDGKTIIGADIKTSGLSGNVYGHMGANAVKTDPNAPAYSGIGFNVNGSGAQTFDAGMWSKDGIKLQIGSGGSANAMSYMSFGDNGYDVNTYSYGGTTITSRGSIALNNNGPAGDIELNGNRVFINGMWVTDRHAEFTNTGFTVSGNNNNWDIGPLTRDSNKTTGLTGYTGPIADVGPYSGSVKVLESGYYTFSCMTQPNGGPGQSMLRIYIGSNSQVLTQYASAGYYWELAATTPIIYLAANDYIRFQVNFANQQTINSRVFVHKINA